MNNQQSSNTIIEADTLIMALLFLMTRYAHSHDKTLIKPIMDHFDWLAGHPQVANSHIQKTSERLRKSWDSLFSEQQTINSCCKVLH